MLNLVSQICNFPTGEFVSADVLESHHKRLKDHARDKLKEIPRLQILEHESDGLEQLDMLIAQKYDNLKKIMKEKQLAENAVAAKKEAESTTALIGTAAYGFGFGFGTAFVKGYFGKQFKV